MKFVAAIHRLFCVFAMLGAILGPVSIGLAENAMANSGIIQMDAISGMGTAMPDAMTGCPKQQSPKPDCGKGCLLALICTTAIVADVADNHGWSFTISWQTHRFDILPTSQLMSALIEPPARPPKA